MNSYCSKIRIRQYKLGSRYNGLKLLMNITEFNEKFDNQMFVNNLLQYFGAYFIMFLAYQENQNIKTLETIAKSDEVSLFFSNIQKIVGESWPIDQSPFKDQTNKLILINLHELDLPPSIIKMIEFKCLLYRVILVYQTKLLGEFIIGTSINQPLQETTIFNYAMKAFTAVISQKYNEEELQIIKERYYSLFENFGEAIFIVTPEMHFLEMNSTTCNLLGYSKEQLMMMRLTDFVLSQELSFQTNNINGHSLSKLTAGIPLLGELKLKNKDGLHLLCDIKLTALSNGNYLGVLHDSSERKLAEVAQRNQKEVEERERNQTKLLQIAAHELRNPMAGIKGILSLINRRINLGKPVENIKQLNQTIEQEINRLSKLLDEVIEALRVKEGRLIFRRQRVNLIEVINAALTPFTATQDQNQHRFTLEGNIESDIWVSGSSNRLEEVIRNLLTNAVKYSNINTEISIKVTLQNNRVLITIQDQGLGIPNTQLQKIFEGFYRATNIEAKNDPGGLGLGLYICQDIIHHHGGRIWAESEEGNGATFFVQLPVLAIEQYHQRSLFDSEELNLSE